MAARSFTPWVMPNLLHASLTWRIVPRRSSTATWSPIDDSASAASAECPCREYGRIFIVVHKGLAGQGLSCIRPHVGAVACAPQEPGGLEEFEGRVARDRIE